ncbi:MAG TPA: hypothetical protein VK308_07900 [Pyrinomonadaceae bacterium]|nr:hypothetical protein [Pyrinomonadaceae bacterium]
MRKTGNEIYIEYDEFAEDADALLTRSQAGERIFITVKGVVKSVLDLNAGDTGGFLKEQSRRVFTTREYERLLEMLEPLE